MDIVPPAKLPYEPVNLTMAKETLENGVVQESVVFPNMHDLSCPPTSISLCSNLYPHL